MAVTWPGTFRTVNRMGTFAPALSQPSGQEFLRLDRGLVVFWRLVRRLHLNVSVGALRLWPAGQREGGEGAPPRGRRPMVVEVRNWVSGTDVDVKKQAGCGNARSSSEDRGKLAAEHWNQVLGRGEPGTG